MEDRALRVVAIGGGTGLSLLLRGLAALEQPLDLCAVVAVSDDGGSSGRLRQELGLPALGDARACLSALSPQKSWASLLEHRFSQGASLSGHAVGNLLLAAMCEQAGSLEAALRLMGRKLQAKGRVLPSTNVAPVLVARLEGGEKVFGQSLLSQREGAVERVELFPQLVPPADGVVEAILAADLVLLGPGSLFSSVIAAALPAGVARALSNSKAQRVFVLNLSQQQGETGGMDALDHITSLREHLGPGAFDSVLVHSDFVAAPAHPDERGEAGEGNSESGSALFPLRAEVSAIRELGIEVHLAEVAASSGRLHHPYKLARAIGQLLSEGRRRAVTGMESLS